MRKLQSVVIVLLLAIPTMLQAQTSVLKINMFSPIARTLNIQYEKALKETSSFQIGFFYTGFSTGDTKVSGFGVTPEYRFYLSDSPAPKGFFVAPFVRYQNFNLTDDFTASEATFSSFGGGLIIGKQWIFKERVALDIFVGPSYNSGSVEVKSGTDSFDTGSFDGFGVRAGVCLGIAF